MLSLLCSRWMVPAFSRTLSCGRPSLTNIIPDTINSLDSAEKNATPATPANPTIQAWLVDFWNPENRRIIKVSEHVYNEPIRLDILHRVVLFQRAQQWQGTSKVKVRSEVRGGGRKPYKQKGTGRARQGSIRSPLWPGGGVVHGPSPKDHSFNLPKKVRRLGLRVALSAKFAQGDLLFVNDLNIPSAKTKFLNDALTKNKITNALFVTGPEVPEGFAQASNNIEKIDVIPCTKINVHQILKHPRLILTEDATTFLEEWLLSLKSGKSNRSLPRERNKYKRLRMEHLSTEAKNL